MYYTRIILFIVFPLFACSPAYSQKASPQNAFGAGERLLFDVGYGFITAGKAVIAVPEVVDISGNPCFKVIFTVNTTPTFSFFFEVRDLYETYLDVEGIYPWRFEQHVREGKYTRDFSAWFDQKNQIAKTTEGEFPIPPYVHDIMSAFFYARTIDFSSKRPGDRIKLQNFYKDKTFPLDVKFLGRQTVKVEAGTFRCIIVEPMVMEGGLFKNEGKILIWLTDDDVKMPVKVSSKVLIGSIDAELTEYFGLRQPLKAKVE